MLNLESISVVAAGALPLFDIPLIVHIIKRKSSQDISLVWIYGMWLCSLGMAPVGIMSSDLVSRTFNIVNVILITAVLFVVIKYRKRGHRRVE